VEHCVVALDPGMSPQEPGPVRSWMVHESMQIACHVLLQAMWNGTTWLEIDVVLI
jgi:hypothetical protein